MSQRQPSDSAGRLGERAGKRKITWKQWLSLGLFIVLLALLAAYVYLHRSDMAVLLRIAMPTLVVLFGLAALSCLNNSLYHRILLRSLDLELTFTDWFGVVCVANTLSYFLPLRADLVFTAAYYKRRRGLRYAKSISLAAGNIIFGVMMSLLQILVALLCVGLMDKSWPYALWLLLLLGVAAVALFLLFSLSLHKKTPRLLRKYKWLGEIIEGFNALLCNRKLLWQLLGVLISGNLLRLCTTLVCFSAIGMPIPVYQALFYAAVSWLATCVAIVPGNIGIKESVMGAATALMGSVFHYGVTVSLLQRVVQMLVYFLFGLLFAVPVYRNMRALPPENTADKRPDKGVE